MYANQDPSIAGMVVDSAMTDLKTLAEELCKTYVTLPSFVLSGGSEGSKVIEESDLSECCEGSDLSEGSVGSEGSDSYNVPEQIPAIVINKKPYRFLAHISFACSFCCVVFAFLNQKTIRTDQQQIGSSHSGLDAAIEAAITCASVIVSVEALVTNVERVNNGSSA